MLETRFGLGLNFLATWAAWRDDPHRPRLLHYVATEAHPASAQDLLQAAENWPELAPMAQALAHRWWGLLPGTHRISLDSGQVLLTLGIADGHEWLAHQHFLADTLYLSSIDADHSSGMWAPELMSALARRCRPGAPFATSTGAEPVRASLTVHGFVVETESRRPIEQDSLHGRFAPPWSAHKPLPQRPQLTSAVVIGGGLAGAAMAASLARRGHTVTVLDQAAHPAAGASGLPAGLFGPHLSTDDAWLSQITRAGMRCTWQTLHDYADLDGSWGATGVLEHRVGRGRHWPHANVEAGRDWTRPADPDTLRAVGLPPDAPAWWHERAGWIQPAALVRALLAQPGIQWQGRCHVSTITRTASGWHVCDPTGNTLAETDWLIVAAGPATRTLLAGPLAALRPQGLPLNEVRGQMTGQLHAAQTPRLPRFAINGHGALIPHVPSAEGPAWYCGATFDRSRQTALLDAADDAANLAKLGELLPELGGACANSARAEMSRPWSGVRCTVADRVPLVGPIAPHALPGLWVSTAMGARGLCLALLCGDIAAAWHGHEPLPLDDRLARHLAAQRFMHQL
ncbi:FAD-dependent 5-carboxymethylaminomethyl-2-thiouridine(34) oxidoreductase MnmC [Hydrogenophaga atypica]|uniref:FAD-dependent 5-carboxymethylaminomethyl-2-thiouridine(34) oxidoreductase MnmC n=1 Tax=Hydrogenophaga atypica TaxID=249409 RepID=A0ABW2QLV1_9BURK